MTIKNKKIRRIDQAKGMKFFTYKVDPGKYM